MNPRRYQWIFSTFLAQCLGQRATYTKINISLTLGLGHLIFLILSLGAAKSLFLGFFQHAFTLSCKSVSEIKIKCIYKIRSSNHLLTKVHNIKTRKSWEICSKLTYNKDTRTTSLKSLDVLIANAVNIFHTFFRMLLLLNLDEVNVYSGLS